jgi:hypothetical protein
MDGDVRRGLARIKAKDLQSGLFSMEGASFHVPGVLDFP